MRTKQKGFNIDLTQGQYDHLYNIMCSQDEIIQYLNESDDFDVQTFENLFDAICNAKETYLK
jgi:hypothetical protein